MEPRHHHFLFTRAVHRVNMVRAIGRREQVDMRVDKARQHRLSTQIHQFGIVSANPAHLVVVAHRQDAPAQRIDRQRARPWLRGVHCVDGAVEINNRAH